MVGMTEVELKTFSQISFELEIAFSFRVVLCSSLL